MTDCPALAIHVDPSTLVDASATWLAAFQAGVSNQDLDALVLLFDEHGFWKDALALTWDLRTVRGHASIRRLLDARLAATGLSAFHLLEDPIRAPTIVRPLPDLVFIRLAFRFETTHGSGIAIAFLVPTSDGTCKAWSLFTKLEGIKAHPEKIGALCPTRLNDDNESWEVRRRREFEFEKGDPTVLVIGAGHCGLGIAARLSSLGVSTLVIDKSQRVGDNWRTRYKSLCLHDTRWHNRMPYLDYPQPWPVYCPASKMGDWLESYATALDLNVWTSSSITNAEFCQETKTWQVSINRGGQTRTMTVKHLVFATGFGGGIPKIPDVPQKELYRGSVLHSSQFTAATDYGGKKVIVVGACNSAIDIALDLSRRECDVTIIQRSPTHVVSQRAMEMPLEDRFNCHFPVEFADALSVALPFPTLKYLLSVSTAQTANGMDKALLDNLDRVGFKTYLGPDGAGYLPLIFERGGGFYFDSGACREIINGNIKVKNSPAIRRFTEGGVELEDGTVLEGDAVIFATGFGDIRSSIEQVCGTDVAAKVGNVWGLDGEGELQGVWRRTGHPRLWIATAGLARSRLHSLDLALQIKAIEEGVAHDDVTYTG